MWIWHVPALYDAALEHAVVHVLEHITFALAGGLYWWHLLSPIRSRKRLGGMGPVMYMVSTKVLVGLLGIGLAFAPDALYDFYETQPGYWGLSPGHRPGGRRADHGDRAVDRHGRRARRTSSCARSRRASATSSGRRSARSAKSASPPR